MLAAPLVSRAGFDADGPAQLRPGAAKSVLLDVALAGARLVAVGERGHVLLSDDAGGSWRQARSVPTRTTLTSLHATDVRTLWAAGHGGVILRSVASYELPDCLRMTVGTEEQNRLAVTLLQQFMAA